MPDKCCIPCFVTDHESYLGCFYDKYDPVRGSTTGAVRVLPNGRLELYNMTIGMCISYCFTTDYYYQDMHYAGLESGNQCWCGAEGAQYDHYGQRNDSECSARCYGNPDQTRGNQFRIKAYDCKLC